MTLKSQLTFPASHEITTEETIHHAVCRKSVLFVLEWFRVSERIGSLQCVQSRLRRTGLVIILKIYAAFHDGSDWTEKLCVCSSCYFMGQRSVRKRHSAEGRKTVRSTAKTADDVIFSTLFYQVMKISALISDVCFTHNLKSSGTVVSHWKFWKVAHSSTNQILHHSFRWAKLKHQFTVTCKSSRELWARMAGCFDKDCKPAKHILFGR